MTIPLVSIVFILAGGLVYVLASGKVAEVGRLLLLVGLLVLGLALAGKGVRLASLIGEGTAHAQVTGAPAPAWRADDVPQPEPQRDDDVPEPTADDPTSPVDQGMPGVDDIATAMRAGRWLVVFGIVLNILVGLMKRHGSRAISAFISPKVGGWLQTKRGVVFTAIALAGAGTIGTAMAAGRMPGFAEIGAALALAWTASGFHAQSTSVAEGQVEVKVEPKKPRSKRASSSAAG